MMRGSFGFGRKLTDRVRSCMREAVQSYSRDVRDTLKDICSTPVKYIGSHVIRSEPGEAPYAETRELMNSFRYRTKEQGNRVESVVYSDSFKSALLEEGTKNIEPRPHWAKVKKMVGSPRAEVKRRFNKCMNSKRRKR